MDAVRFPNFHPTAVAGNVRKLDALTERETVAHLLIACNHDMGLVKLRVLAEQSRRQAAKLSPSK